jgi:acyl-homoserine-lactone acylase
MAPRCWSAGVAAVAAVIVIASGPAVYGQRAGRVEIRRDTFGVPHILAADEHAAGFGFGYAMAEDHAAEIGRRYLQARGEAARHLGAGYAESDLAMRRFDNRGAARRALAEETGGGFRRWLAGFAAGVNRYVATHRDAVPAFMPVIEPSDPLAYGRMFGILAAVRPPAELLEKYPSPVLTVNAAARASYPADEAARGEIGSNAFAIAGTKTLSGRPILLGNPHLSWSSLYWEAHVAIPGRINFYGSTLVGIPVLRAGFNDRLGYVQTNNAPDLDDIYSLPLVAGRPDLFLHDRRERRIARRQVAVDVLEADGTIATVQRDYEETDLGPVIHRTTDRLFVIRSVNVEWWRQYEGFFELLKVRSLDDFRDTLARGLTVTSNYTYADIDGNILYAWNARLPRRPAFTRGFGEADPAVIDYALDVPGETKTFFWKGMHRARDLPSLLNPSSGYIQNANNPPWWTSLRDPLDPARYPPYIERGELSLRAQAMLEALEATPRFSPDSVRELKFSTRMLAADRMLPDLIGAARAVSTPSEPLRAGLDALAAWDRHAGAGSRGAVLFDRFRSMLDNLRDEAFAAPWDPLQPATTPRGLADPAAALEALERAVLDLRQQYGSERVPWGDVNRFRLGSIDLPGDGSSGRHGLVRVVGFDAAADGTRVAGRAGPDQLLAGSGDAWVLLVHFTRPVTAWSVLAYGQTTDLSSPHSRDQIRLFAKHELRPVWFTEEQIAANLERRYEP